MKVILMNDVANLGEEGDILNVSPGYARNFLLPGKVVTLYNRQNLAILEARKVAIEKKKEEKRLAAQSEKEKLGQTVITVSMPAGENGKLFGSVSNTTISEELAKLGIQVERKKIDIPGNLIKSTGDYKIHVRLYGNESADLKLQVVAVKTDARGNAIAPSAPANTAVAEAPVAPTEGSSEEAKA